MPEDQGSAFHLDTGEENTTAQQSEQGRGVVFVAEQDRPIDARRAVGGDSIMPRWRGVNSNAKAGDQARMTDDVVQVRPRDGPNSTLLSLRDYTRTEDALPIHGADIRKRPARTFEQRRSKNGADDVASPSISMLASGGDEWAVAGPDDDASNTVSKAGDTANDDEQAPTAEHLDRTPRVMTVSVKPKRNQQPTLASSQDQNSATSPQRQVWQTGNNTNNNISDTGLLSSCNDGIDSNKASPTTPRFAAVRSGILAAERTADRHDGQPSSGDGGASVEGASLGTDSASSWAKETGTKNSASGPSSPVTAASRLGLEGNGFPDASEFNLDDISEIDAGGEWAGSDGGGGGSLSS